MRRLGGSVARAEGERHAGDKEREGELGGYVAFIAFSQSGSYTRELIINIKRAWRGGLVRVIKCCFQHIMHNGRQNLDSRAWQHAPKLEYGLSRAKPPFMKPPHQQIGRIGRGMLLTT